MLSVVISLFMIFCEVVLKFYCVTGVFICGLGLGCVIITQKASTMLEWLGERGCLSLYKFGFI